MTDRRGTTCKFYRAGPLLRDYLASGLARPEDRYESISPLRERVGQRRRRCVLTNRSRRVEPDFLDLADEEAQPRHIALRRGVALSRQAGRRGTSSSMTQRWRRQSRANP